MTLNKPIATFTTIWSLWATFPSREDVITKFGDKWTDPANIVVNGPFTLTEFVPKDHATLKPNPNWTGTKPALQQITVKFIDDLRGRLQGVPDRRVAGDEHPGDRRRGRQEGRYAGQKR